MGLTQALGVLSPSSLNVRLLLTNGPLLGKKPVLFSQKTEPKNSVVKVGKSNLSGPVFPHHASFPLFSNGNISCAIVC